MSTLIHPDSRLLSGTVAGELAAGCVPPEICRWMQRMDRLPSIRRERVECIRREIAAGTYETPRRLRRAVANFLAEEFV
ncbi:MAG: flagellar biosynthesis anti-sigma factor FlgM [Phycisphaerae bacterium]|nr:flagellar biosynthesis anti-sigma factor FlgM [Phycisphaerae bacterium]